MIRFVGANDCDFRRPPQNHNVDVIGCPAGVRQGTSGPTYDGLVSAQFRAWRPGQRRQGERLRYGGVFGTEATPLLYFDGRSKYNGGEDFDAYNKIR